jgi:hypothetical protein
VSFLQSTIKLAADIDALLVILSSKQANVDSLADRPPSTPGARGLIVEVDEDWNHPDLPRRTSDSDFVQAKADRKSDLSKKRNLGLLLARLHGWNKVMFLDDDIQKCKADSVARLANQLDFRQAAGMCVREFPDNSVVCHARRLAKMPQGVFVTGAALGVHCNNLPLSFFPDIYNEDWFFFAKEAAARRLSQVGFAVQEKYDPYASSDRARWEEFGDLLAEGLYSWFERWSSESTFFGFPAMPSSNYWRQFIDARHEVLTETSARLGRLADQSSNADECYSALGSVAAAQGQLADAITADLCVSFIDAWLDDLHNWEIFSSSVNNVGSTREAMDFLGLGKWRLAGLGNAEFDDFRCA